MMECKKCIYETLKSGTSIKVKECEGCKNIPVNEQELEMIIELEQFSQVNAEECYKELLSKSWAMKALEKHLDILGLRFDPKIKIFLMICQEDVVGKYVNAAVWIYKKLVDLDYINVPEKGEENPKRKEPYYLGWHVFIFTLFPNGFQDLRNGHLKVRKLEVTQTHKGGFYKAYLNGERINKETLFKLIQEPLNSGVTLEGLMQKFGENNPSYEILTNEVDIS